MNLKITELILSRNATVFRTSPRVNGCVDGVYNLQVGVWNVVCARTRQGYHIIEIFMLKIVQDKISKALKQLNLKEKLTSKAN